MTDFALTIQDAAPQPEPAQPSRKGKARRVKVAGTENEENRAEPDISGHSDAGVGEPPLELAPIAIVVTAPAGPPHLVTLRALIKAAGQRDPYLVSSFAAECAARATRKARGEDQTRASASARSAASQCEAWIADIATKEFDGKTAARCAVDAAVSAADYELRVWDARADQMQAVGGTT